MLQSPWPKTRKRHYLPFPTDCFCNTWLKGQNFSDLWINLIPSLMSTWKFYPQYILMAYVASISGISYIMRTLIEWYVKLTEIQTQWTKEYAICNLESSSLWRWRKLNFGHLKLAAGFQTQVYQHSYRLSLSNSYLEKTWFFWSFVYLFHLYGIFYWLDCYVKRQIFTLIFFFP